MSISEMVMILLIAVVVFKPEQLPEIARMLGRWMRWIRSFSKE